MDLSHRKSLTTLGQSDEHDAFWTLASAGGVISAASCYSLYTLDERVGTFLTQTPTPSLLAQTEYSANSLRRAKITSLQLSSLCPQNLPLLVLSTTDDVQYYDPRNARSPLCSWAHRRGYDRTLSLCPVPLPGPDAFVLASQRNRLLITYGMQVNSHQGTQTLQQYTPQSVVSSVPPNLESVSPTPPFLADLGALGWEGVACLLEQGSSSALWLRSLRRENGIWPDIHVEWSLDAHEQARDALEMEDPGPFGDTEVTPVDYCDLYKGT